MNQTNRYKIPSPMLVRSLRYIKKQNPIALDIGSGKGREVSFLLENGFDVTALDPNEKLLNSLADKHGENDKFHPINQKLEEFELEKYDLIHARNSLQFISKSTLTKIWPKLLKALNKEGLLVCTFFGKSHEWNNDSESMWFYSKEEVLMMLKDYKLLEFTDSKKYMYSYQGKLTFTHTFEITIQNTEKS